MLSAIIVAAGSSRRMGFDKLMAPLAGIPVLQHSIQTFLLCPAVEELILVCPEERFAQLELQPTDKPLIRVDGGADRHNSVSNGLAALSPNSRWVAVHDGARPLITEKQILSTLAAAKDHQAATSARRVTETVKRADQNQFIQSPVDRENLWLMETPQIFDKSLLLKSYANVESSGSLVTDEVSALELIGVPTFLQPNASPNLKITFPEDLALAEHLLTFSA
ncbi:2-C-methyl-D-erythritol 4-phosphate cytidylyltransferase [Rubritalea tangerina]|uniref:2-C-methyl-D-erythritol 4-phosphate cytidylyltransferase n=1 Tax=Rubritalea tangerina TaxID=430798 RepID=A0ABW4ZB74_9BACT